MRFRKKPVVIEAVQFNEQFWGDLDKWLTDSDAKHMFVVSPDRMSLHIETLEGTMVAYPGDWIIKGVQGEFYPCKPDIFEQTYEVVDD